MQRPLPTVRGALPDGRTSPVQPLCLPGERSQLR